MSTCVYEVGLVRVGLDGGGGGQANLVEILFQGRLFTNHWLTWQHRSLPFTYYYNIILLFIFFLKKDKIKLQMTLISKSIR